jgi:hypothetical protein
MAGAMIPHMKSFVLAVAAVAVLAACETPVQVERFPELTYDHLTSFQLNTLTVQVKSDYTPPLAPPNVDHLFPTPPKKAMERWGVDRLKAAGSQGSARFTIIDASIIETKLKLEPGITGALTKQQAFRYDATVEGSLEVMDSRGFRKGFASARVRRSRTVREDATLNDRDRIWFNLVEDLMRDFNAEIEKNIRQHLGGHLM